jgi:hypothetical protein
MTAVGHPPILRAGDRTLASVAIAVAGVAGAAAAVGGPTVVLAILVVGAFAAVAARPVLGVMGYLAAAPFIAGIERGAVLPLVRPQEGLELFVILAVATGWLVRYAAGETASVRITRLDRALVALALVGSVWPLASALARGVELTGQDLASLGQLWRYLGLYVLVRCAVRTAGEVRACLWIVLLSAAVLSVIALLQSLGVGGVESLLSKWYLTGESSMFEGRGSATLGNPIAVGDYLATTLAVAIIWYQRRPEARVALLPIGLLLAAGLVGTGQFSAWIAAVSVVVLLARRDRQIAGLLARALPLGAAAVAVGWPVVAKRLVELPSRGVPVSWIVRADNLQTFYLPHLAGWGFVLGVRPDTVVPAPETWRDQVFLESGYLALLWIGGLPLLVAFIAFVAAALRHTRRVAAARTDDIGTAALATWVALWVLVILTVLDIHLTLRGGADLLFVLLGLSANRLVAPERAFATRGTVGAGR